MPESSPADIQFLNELHDVIAKNLANEQFGVTELAEAMNMSRSNLLRKVKKSTNLPVNQLIREARLKRAMELLQNSASNVSEVSHQVGFNSTSYFIKCFREHYGYPPGEAGKRSVPENTQPVVKPKSKRRLLVWGGVATLMVILILGYILYTNSSGEQKSLERSIIVLPFKNDSNDSTNVYLINGLMESTLNNLQKIEDLRVLSRTSSEKYRTSTLSIPEMARELDVTYFIEGSGQKIGDNIVLNIQLIEGPTDKHIWARQYRRKATDIFELQREIAKDIAEEIEVAISLEVRERIDKKPTENLEAYDSFLKGVDLLRKGGDQNLEKSFTYFDEAIQKDNTFAAAYACAAFSCYYLDIFKADKTNLERLGQYADKALLNDPKLGESLRAKAMYFLLRKEYHEALPYLEKDLEYNPNSSEAVGLMADFYYMYLPNTGKYLEYALKGLRLDVSGDSVSRSNLYLRVGNALAQSGFIDQSLTFIDKSIAFNPRNPFSWHLRAFVVYAQNKNLPQVKESLLKELKKDTNRFDILQDVAKVSYYLQEYDSSYYYYKRFVRLRELFRLDVFRHENMMVGIAYIQAGEKAKGEAFIEDYYRYMLADQTAYRDLGLFAYYDYKGDTQKALEHLRTFAKQENIQYWIILFMRQQPMPGNVSKIPESQKLLDEIESNFWATHKNLAQKLEEKGLL